MKEGRSYEGVNLSDPDGKWVYYSPMSWHPDIAPSAPVPVCRTPDKEEIPYALPVSYAKRQETPKLPVKIKGAGGDFEEKIAYLSESRTNPEKYEALIGLPENTGVPGASGTIFRSENGEKHKYCIPVTALYIKEDRNFIYVLKEREGILGQEYYVDEMNVKVIDKNENWAALEEGTLDKDSQIIISATMEIKKGDVVRWEQ